MMNCKEDVDGLLGGVQHGGDAGNKSTPSMMIKIERAQVIELHQTAGSKAHSIISW
jgi:hypothetical protein